MKKNICMLILMLLCVSLFGCNGDIQIKEYDGTPLTQLKYQSIDYNGGYIEEYIFDFNDNSVKVRGYLPDKESETNFETIAEFTDQQEQTLINKLYTYSLFDIKREYKSPEGILDGGGWNLEIKYADGTNKLSIGSNNSPRKVFENSAKAFYDICRQGIVADVPANYYLPPNISYSIEYTIGNNTTSYGYSFGKMANYKWNGFEENSCKIYELNQENELPLEINDKTKYVLVLYTANYRDYERFNKCEVTTYDYNEEMSNKKKIIDKGWFDQIEFDLEFNKIYVIKLSFSNGDFVEYTFNTKL